MIELAGKAYGMTYEYTCEEVRRTADEAVFRTLSDPPHQVRLTPRYEGSRIGDEDIVVDEGPATVCAFYIDGKYAALALFVHSGSDIKIVPYEL